MPTQITNQATLTYTYGSNTGSAASNIATMTLEGPLSARKHVLERSYRAEEDLTYIISISNTGAMALTNVSVVDNLGAYTPAGGTDEVMPLTYVGPAELYINGLFSAELTPVVSADGVTFTVPSIPAGGSALILYLVDVNDNALLTPGSIIENTATVSAESLSEDVTVSAQLPVDAYADITIIKAMSPDPVTEGSLLTYTFTIYNYGNTDAENVVLTDQFDPAPSQITVTVDGAAVPATDYSYIDGELILPDGSSNFELTVPAATFTQDPDTGVVSVNPGVVTVVVTGII